MLNIAETVNTYLKTEISGLPTIYNDLFPVEDGDLIVSRHDPSQSAAREFADGSRYVEASFSYYARCKKAGDAREWLEKITKQLENEQIVRQADNVSFQSSVATLPQFVETDDKGQTIYMMSVVISYLDGQKRP